MSSIKDRLNEPASPRPGIGGELHHMRENGRASAQELRDFLKSVKGRSPQEVLGVVAQSGLATSILFSTIGCVVLLVVCSVIPYQLNKLSASEESEKSSAKAKVDSEEENTATPPPANQQATKTTEPQNETPGNGPDPSLPDKLGIGETKNADAKTNPLDSKIDNLLDGDF
ncbi:MAG: hypothetical protein KDA84_00005 [Planctomycetaceae bacterium]|nr:hypothetical protein [Planctomycetaceae bacterium]